MIHICTLFSSKFSDLLNNKFVIPNMYHFKGYILTNDHMKIEISHFILKVAIYSSNNCYLFIYLFIETYICVSMCIRNGPL